MARGRPASITVGLKLPFFELSGTWAPDEAERRAAWEMYVELVTRIGMVPLPSGEGLLREALTSLHSLFATTRDILRRYGPDVARPTQDSDLSFGSIAITVLNQALRPLLTVWHPALADHESRRPPARSPAEHEREWEDAPALREELERMRPLLIGYANMLSEAADVPPLVSAAPADRGSG